MIIEQIEDSIKIHNSPMIEKILSTFGMENFHIANTPLSVGLNIESSMRPSSEEGRDKMKKTPYTELVGTLLHPSNTVQPDISFAVGFLSRFMGDSGIVHWHAAKHVIRYLKNTSNSGIVYQLQDLEPGGVFYMSIQIRTMRETFMIESQQVPLYSCMRKGRSVGAVRNKALWHNLP